MLFFKTGEQPANDNSREGRPLVGGADSGQRDSTPRPEPTWASPPSWLSRLCPGPDTPTSVVGPRSEQRSFFPDSSGKPRLLVTPLSTPSLNFILLKSLHFKLPRWRA
ncbi:zinc finger BED domain-containing protein 5 isoform X2 [Marmota monax]|uniref:zinc finger BED domain-containing protein 5 isoform X2 n=1 Tax=Marmota monax TaxID=9995 RepID=UPI0026ECF367|nr:zinc finger BED domain-containing protein 5 isoform X2 [Marmota monax]